MTSSPHKLLCSLTRDVRARCLWLMVALVSAWVSACGGGGMEGTGSFGYTAGPVAGFGSIIVNDVRFDESGARIENEDGSALSRDALRLGMGVEVDSGSIIVSTGGSNAVASRVRRVTALVGIVGARDPAAGTLTVFGQPVRTNAGTVFDDALPSGLGSVVVGSVVIVDGLLDAGTGVTTATRLAPGSASEDFRIRGVVSGLDTTTLRFSIGTQTFRYTSTGAPDGLANGAIVRLRVQPEPDSLGYWNVLSSSEAVRVPDDDTETEVEGRVSAFTTTSRFEVDGLPVDASAARFEPSAAAVVAGARVEVEGTMQSGVLVATRVKVEDEDGGGGGSGDEIEVSGAITSVDSANRRFVVRNTTIEYDDATRFDDGSEADITVGREVEVRGALNSDQTAVLAERIKFE
jgi:Domain of unknown function (DUF5666)